MSLKYMYVQSSKTIIVPNDIHNCILDCLFRERDQLGHYFRLLTALEYNSQTLANQQAIVHMMVDMCNAVSTISINTVMSHFIYD